MEFESEAVYWLKVAEQHYEELESPEAKGGLAAEIARGYAMLVPVSWQNLPEHPVGADKDTRAWDFPEYYSAGG